MPEGAAVGSEAHCSAHVVDALLLFHQVDDVVRCVGSHLGGVGVLKPEDVACEFYHHALHAEAYAEGGQVVGAAPFEGDELTFDASLPESGGYDGSVDAFEKGGDIAGGDLFGVDVADADFLSAVGGGLEERLVDGLVGVLEFDVFSYESDGHGVGGRVHAGEEFVPRAHVGLSRWFYAGFTHHDLVEMLTVHQHRDLIDGGCVGTLHHGVGGHVAELGDLFLHRGGDVVLGAEHEHIGLNAELL